jgi:hypothetical protein
MMKPQYLRVRNWERFQHYTNRRPPWVKYHVELLDDYELLQLTLETQLVFDRLLLLAARTDNNIPHDPEHIGRQITIDPGIVQEAIESLLLTDHLLMSGRKRAASAAIARRKQSSRSSGGTEAEAETEAEEEQELSDAREARGQPLVCNQCGVGGGLHVADCPTVAARGVA